MAMKGWAVGLGVLATLLLLGAGLGPTQAKDQAADRGLGRTAAQEDRVALVIGNQSYPEMPLRHSLNDARDIRDALKRLGFRVVYREDAPLEAMDAALTEFKQALRQGSIGLFYYSGHGAQVDGKNYLIPLSTSITSKAALKARAFDVNIVLGEMQEAGNALNIVILDACRNNPFKGFRATGDGLAGMNGPEGSLIAFATAPDRTASDGATGRNGTYTKHLLAYLDRPGLKLEDLFKQVRQAVRADTGGEQTPWENSSLMGDFCFAGCAGASTTAPTAPSPVAGDTWTEPKTGMQFVWVPGGSFRMGCDGPWADDCEIDQKPEHDVDLKGFWLGRTEVTQAQWRKVMDSNPSKFPRFWLQGCADCPVERVSWDDAQAFIAKLDPGGSQGLRLPTEAEWEYACRSGDKDEHYCGGTHLDRLAWYDKNSGDTTHPVGGKAANGLGLYDMSGNVWEWTCSLYAQPYDGSEQGCLGNNDTKSARAIRGGSWYDDRKSTVATRRYSAHPTGDGRETLGVRLARTLSP